MPGKALPAGDGAVEAAPESAPGRSIGEVIGELRGDFPDISVSKIRFLESQGLITPGRASSGYRQFSDRDVALLRWILTQQREHYLPLKVIRRRLRDGDGPGSASAAGGPGSASAAGGPGDAPVPTGNDEAGPAADPAPGRSSGSAGLSRTGAPAGAGEIVADLEGLDATAAVDGRLLSELASFGLIPGGEPDEGARRVAAIAARFAQFGVEARHLRMYRTFADREAALFAQVVGPGVGSRGEVAARAAETIDELCRLGQLMHGAMLRAALGSSPAG